MFPFPKFWGIYILDNAKKITPSFQTQHYFCPVTLAIAPKKTKYLWDHPWWKCSVCTQKSIRFESIKELNIHTMNCHPSRSFLCNKCPYTAMRNNILKKHQRMHDPNDVKFKENDQTRVCKLCDAYFETDAAQRRHDSINHW